MVEAPSYHAKPVGNVVGDVPQQEIVVVCARRGSVAAVTQQGAIKDHAAGRWCNGRLKAHRPRI
jgi:hypothetical protein